MLRNLFLLKLFWNVCSNSFKKKFVVFNLFNWITTQCFIKFFIQFFNSKFYLNDVNWNEKFLIVVETIIEKITKYKKNDDFKQRDFEKNRKTFNHFRIYFFNESKYNFEKKIEKKNLMTKFRMMILCEKTSMMLKNIITIS